MSSNTRDTVPDESILSRWSRRKREAEQTPVVKPMTREILTSWDVHWRLPP